MIVSNKSAILCATPLCAEYRQKYDQHRVYDRNTESYLPKGWLADTVAWCEQCGGHTDGKTWRHVCKSCGAEVEPGKLQGLFVPSRCPACQQSAEDDDRKNNRRCRMCNALSINCCC